METDVRLGGLAPPPTAGAVASGDNIAATKQKNKSKDKDAAANKRRCVSTACIACRRRKSKCDGNLPKCAACASVYLTECEYAPHTDHRRKGVYKKDADNLKTKNATLQILIQAILNAEEDEQAFDLVRQIRACDSLEDLAQVIENKERGIMDTPDSPIYGEDSVDIPQFEAELSGKMGDLVLDGSVKFIGGTSNLIWLNDPTDLTTIHSPSADGRIPVKPREEAILSWTTVTQDKDLILHLLNMYFCWHYAYFTTLSKELFYRDFLTGTDSQYCSALLVNVMLALGCHFSSKPAARSNPEDSSTTGDHFFAEAKRLLHSNDEFGIPKMCTVQALALMSVREAGCGRESKGWIYSGLSFRLASDLGLNVDAESLNDHHRFTDEEIDARRISFWGCFLFDKCWSNYLGRQPQLLLANCNVKKPDVFGAEDSELWSPYTDSGIVHTHTQPARTRAVSLQIIKLAEISSDLLSSFYQPQLVEKQTSKQNELKRLSDIHTRLEAWRKDLPPEMEVKDGQLPQVLLMHMFYQLLYIHLYRPFLKYTKATSPLPNYVSPRKFCTQAASAISKLFRLYKRTHGLRQICNIAVYIAHSACTIHLLNLPDKNAKRDIIHGIKQLEEIGESWICARRTVRMLGLCADKWKIDLPDEARAALQRTNQRWRDSVPPPSTGPSSPDSAVTVLRAPAPSVSDIVNHNMQQLQQIQQYSGSDVSHGNLDRSLPMTEDTTTSLRNAIQNHLSMQSNLRPPLNNGLARSKLSVRLTQAQQDAWNSHQAKMGHATPSGVRTPNEPQIDAATLFGGVDSLVEESQDWWYQDQSQIAIGFDNWNTPPSADWSHAAAAATPASLGIQMTSEPAIAYPTTQSMEQFFTSAPMSNGAGHVAGYLSQQQQQQQQHNMQNFNPRHQSTSSANPSSLNGQRVTGNMNPGPAARKRTSSYDDDLMY